MSSGRDLQTPSSLLDRMRSDDRAAWERFIYLYAPLVYHWCRKAGLQSADALDVGQEVFHSVSKSIDGFRRESDNGTFRGWLRIITQNKTNDFFRKEKPGSRGLGGSGFEAYVQLVESEKESSELLDIVDRGDERLVVLRRAIELILCDCKEQTRQAFWKVVVESQSVADVACELGMTKEAIYCVKSRILSRLRMEFTCFLEIDSNPTDDDASLQPPS